MALLGFGLTVRVPTRLLRLLLTGAQAGAFFTVAAMGQELDEYRVKAAFLYNFAKFVQWPAQVFKNSSTPIAICVLGPSPILRPIEEAVVDKTIEGRAIVVTTRPDIKRANGCQILFVSSALPQDARSMGVLTVGETAGFAAEGGVVNFKIESGRVRFEINQDAAEKSGLKISSKLLSLAEIVKTRANPK
jgi:hypothetical protein